MANVNFVKKARKDVPNSDIKKGESYYWWQHKFGTKQVSKTQPKPSQITQSGFLSAIYGIQETIESLGTNDELDTAIEDIISELETLRDECEEKRDNMPEQLQDSGSGELLQNRADSVQEMIDELDSVDCDIDDPTDEEIKDEAGEKEEKETEEEYEDRLTETRDDIILGKKEEILEEIQNISYNGE